MSARYVWGKYLIYFPPLQFNTTNEFQTGTPSGACTFCSSFEQIVDGEFIRYKASGILKRYSFSSASGFQELCATYPYVILHTTSSESLGRAICFSQSGEWRIKKIDGYPSVFNFYLSENQVFQYAIQGKSSEIKRGDFVSNISSQKPNEYPNSGIKGSNFYEYKGSDTIDPSAVTYSKQDLYPGELVTITADPVTPTYGGIISYQYQYSLDGGSTWTNIGSKTTSTSKTMNIPEGAEQFQARVQASDGWGFTSTTYVYGPNLPVSQIKAYAAVGGKLVAGAKMYATVGEKIRQVQKGYVTVGGKIRKLF